MIFHSHKYPTKRIFICIAIIIISAIASLIVLNYFHKLPANNLPLPTAPIKTVTVKKVLGRPVTIEIPSIAVKAHIAYVGVKSNGDMDISDDPTAVAWYEFGPKPGDIGNAVIAGHYGWTDNKPSIFNDLNKLKAGDIISIVDEQGLKTSFSMTSSKDYSPNADATDIFKSDDGKSHLNLITCEGFWETDKNTYSNRLVIFADKIDQ